MLKWKNVLIKIVEVTEKAFNLEAGPINMDTVLARFKPGQKAIMAGGGMSYL